MFMSGLPVWNATSSANKSENQCFSKRGKSFINNRNRVGPKLEPCGTPDRLVEKADSPVHIYKKVSKHVYAELVRHF